MYLPRIAKGDLDFAASGVTAHSGSKVNKTQHVQSRRLAGDVPNWSRVVGFRHVVSRRSPAIAPMLLV